MHQVHVVVQYSCAVFMTVLDVHQHKEYKEKNYAALLPPCGIVVRRTLFYYLCVQKCKKKEHSCSSNNNLFPSIDRQLETLADLLETIFVDLGAINHES